MALCEDCSPECEHEYCDNCTKCHLCGTYASAPAAPPANPGQPKQYRNPEWVTPRNRIAPAFNEQEYLRYAVSTHSMQQIH